MKLKSLSIPLITLLLALPACGPSIQSGARFAPGVDVSRPLTFAWDASMMHVEGDPRLQNNPFFLDRLHEAVDWELGMRGIRRVDSSPDLLVHHHLSLADHEMLDEVIDEAGTRRVEAYAYEEGTVVVHLTDARTGETVWVGWSRANTEPALTSPENMRKWVYEMVRGMFRTWPTAGR
jgi:hypothetical protein